jgi:methyltransferase (TIGR00027 family)
MLETANPSRTALSVAIRRATHQLYDAHPLVLEDPIAVPILGETYRPRLEEAGASVHDKHAIGMRAWLVSRSRYAEDTLAQAVNRDVRQYVLLGAGLDTFAHRNPYPGLTVFEVDQPATQQWKRELLASSGLPEPSNLRYVPVDFEQQSLATQLQKSGLDASAPTVFAWLGVVMYLTLAAFRATLGFIATSPQDSAVIIDYGLPRHALPAHEQAGRDALAARVQNIGEPFQLFFTPAEMATELSAFRAIENLGPPEIHARYFAQRTDQLRLMGSGGHFVSAWC